MVHITNSEETSYLRRVQQVMDNAIMKMVPPKPYIWRASQRTDIAWQAL